MDAERENFAQMPRRGFLRQLCALPMIGGGVTLIGQPTAAAVPISDALLEGYNTWLDKERSWLAWERAKGDAQRFRMHMGVLYFDHPAADFDHTRHGGPSSRAALVLSAAGVPLVGGSNV